LTLDIVCRVVDNYGDIGVVFRLARALSELPTAPRLRLIVDDLGAFNRIEPSVDPAAPAQRVRGWTVLSWSGPTPASAAAFELAYRGDPARVVIECFACGRPDWLEAMLFDPACEARKTIVNLEYLTAEGYAEEFHRMPSLTRSSSVRKHMFLPGFTEKTGGLILDRAYMGARERTRTEILEGIGIDDGPLLEGLAGLFWIVVFGYERDYRRIVDDIAEFSRERPVLALVAHGKSAACFSRAWEGAGRPFQALDLPFMRQEAWDEVLVASDFLVVRGEDSMARAALSGKPFLWQAYPQDGAHQLVKVAALLGRMRPHFSEADFSAIEAAFLAFNDRLSDGDDVAGSERIYPLLSLGAEGRAGFEEFSESLVRNGNLASALMTFLREIV